MYTAKAARRHAIKVIVFDYEQTYYTSDAPLAFGQMLLATFAFEPPSRQQLPPGTGRIFDISFRYSQAMTARPRFYLALPKYRASIIISYMITFYIAVYDFYIRIIKSLLVMYDFTSAGNY